MSRAAINTPVSRFMTTSPMRVEVTSSLSAALALMKKMQIRHLPVTEKGKLVGVVSNRDIAALFAAGAANSASVLVRDAMTPNPYTVSPETPLSSVTEVMVSRKYGSVIVVDKEMLVGIFTTIDALRALHEICMESAKYAST